MIRRPPRSTLSSSSAASDVYKRQYQRRVRGTTHNTMGCSQSDTNQQDLEVLDDTLCTCGCPDRHRERGAAERGHHLEGCSCECPRCVECQHQPAAGEVEAPNPVDKKARFQELELPLSPRTHTLLQQMRRPEVRGVRGARWQEVEPGQEMPAHTLMAGFFQGSPRTMLHIGRMQGYRGGVYIGQTAQCIGGLQLCVEQNEVIMDRGRFEVLVDELPGVLRWKDRPQTAKGWARLANCAVPLGIEVKGRFNTSVHEFVPGKHGSPMWAARVFYKGQVLVGRTGPSVCAGRVALVPVRANSKSYSGEVQRFTEFQVLVNRKLDLPIEDQDAVKQVLDTAGMEEVSDCLLYTSPSPRDS
eukprot:TRINITY_DN1586_c0_g1_i2.p1 TRINITY_DN1586_c0_g1~~TRINITY_DN1586_c0_g1_i2.p1  ORF type:complete len:357 (+),score=67.24 TRINITY_DN1586_c0_g1_i2:126-1196(+)